MNEDVTTPVYSYWPLFLAIGVVLIAIGVVWTFGISVLGILLVFTSIIGWTWENRSTSEEAEDDNA